MNGAVKKRKATKEEAIDVACVAHYFSGAKGFIETLAFEGYCVQPIPFFEKKDD